MLSRERRLPAKNDRQAGPGLRGGVDCKVQIDKCKLQNVRGSASVISPVSNCQLAMSTLQFAIARRPCLTWRPRRCFETKRVVLSNAFARAVFAGEERSPSGACPTWRRGVFEASSGRWSSLQDAVARGRDHDGRGILRAMRSGNSGRWLSPHRRTFD